MSVIKSLGRSIKGIGPTSKGRSERHISCIVMKGSCLLFKVA